MSPVSVMSPISNQVHAARHWISLPDVAPRPPHSCHACPYISWPDVAPGLPFSEGHPAARPPRLSSNPGLCPEPVLAGGRERESLLPFPQGRMIREPCVKRLSRHNGAPAPLFHGPLDTGSAPAGKNLPEREKGSSKGRMFCPRRKKSRPKDV